MAENDRDQITQSCPLRRIGAPDDVADIAIVPASRAGAYVNGAVIHVVGGIVQQGQIPQPILASMPARR